jgi:hypothetical protein
MATEQSTIDKITSWAGGKFGTLASPFGGTGIAPTVEGGGGVMKSDGTGTGYMFKSQANTATPTGIAAPQGMLGAGSSPAKPAAPAAPATGMLGAAPTAAKAPVDYTSQLNDLYKSTLKRDGDAAGMQWFSERLNSGATDLEGVRAALQGSSEWKRANTIETPTALTARNVDPSTETVQGQLQKVLAADSPVLQQARAEGMRTGFDRGLGNSTIAASAGADALTRAATGIAATDAGVYGDAASYNTTASNQLFMYDRDQVAQFKKLEMQLGADEAARQMQVDLAKMQDATSRYATDTNAASNAAQQANQMSIAQMNDATQKYQAETSAATSRYNTDTNYKQTVEGNKKTLVNNILNNMELSPDRKAALLEQLGEGTSAKDGTPGTGLAGAVYVIDSVGADLNFADAAQNAGR